MIKNTREETLPGLLMTSEPGSFARHTIQVRKPAIIDLILSHNDYPSGTQKSLLDFKEEISAGTIQPLMEISSDRQVWLDELEPWLSKSWLELPWYFAETYFYRRILEITSYFQPGPWMGIDPFARMKQEEIDASLPDFVEEYSRMSPGDTESHFQTACYKALWGNRGDLSHFEVMDTRLDAQLDRILIDHSKQAFQFIDSASGNMAYFCDNVGKELYFDLALIDWFLENGYADRIDVFLKNQPFFVSDATEDDLERSLHRLGASDSLHAQKLADRLINQLRAGRLQIQSPFFTTSAKDFRQMPPVLKQQISTYNLVILKGDANYRRLFGDRHWHPTTSISEAGGYFPTSFLSFRTLKAELVIGLSEVQLQDLSAMGEKEWMTNGKRGMITLHRKQ